MKKKKIKSTEDDSVFSQTIQITLKTILTFYINLMCLQFDQILEPYDELKN